ncbi:hypothetical protein [Clostridium beijerinckii]|nr:hypothetical protein [Clostridium beijerinckii]NRT77892.1 hypothetical protein [Clostridium beijerinckii]OOM42377.1 hypothetical protein CBEIJ_43250 [Clostridium beijerinckii]
MKSEYFIEGQISIFDLPAIEVIKPKKIDKIKKLEVVVDMISPSNGII